MPDDVESLTVADCAGFPEPRDPMVADSTVQPNQRPVRGSGIVNLPGNDFCAGINVSIGNNEIRRIRVQHPVPKDEADIGDVLVLDAMPGCGNNIWSNENAGTKRANGLLPEPLRRTEVIF